MPLHTDFRPVNFDQIIGNAATVAALQKLTKTKNPPHTFLFTGPAGCGKTTMARIVAEALNCKGRDLQELNTADFRGIDTAREINRMMKLTSNRIKGGNRGFILDEAHKLTNDAQNALLKTLEEPPKHAYFFLCTTDPQKLLKTVISRCSEYKVEPLNDEDCSLLLSQAVEFSGSNGKGITEKIIDIIVESSQGHPRQALTILEKVLAVPEKERLSVAKQANELEAQVIELCRALIQKKGWKTISSLLKNLQNEDPENIRRAVLGYASAVMMNGKVEAYVVMDAFREPFYNTGRPGLVMACYEALEG